ncbi:MAG: glutamyl-tRNA reductase [Phycisphaerales bacterium]|nr:glutamyl-tRNA reductase [Phycisphaerales bacterium]
MKEKLVCLEVSHKTAPLAVRERIAMDRDALVDRLAVLRPVCSECVILKTCGRFELYVVSNEPCGRWFRYWADLVDVPVALFEPYCREFRGEAAVDHLFHVAAGLESPILGEDQILGQVRDAFLVANEVGTVGPILSSLFRGAIHVGKRARHETAIGRTARSYAELAFESFKDAFSQSRKVIVLGSGTLAREVVLNLAKDGKHDLTVVSRHVRRAEVLASKANGQARSLDELATVIGESDILIACTSSSRCLVKASMLRGVRRPLIFIDFGMPRNVDPDVASFSNVQLRSLEQFVSYSHVTDEAIGAALHIIEGERSRFLQWLAARRVAPLIAELRSLVDGLDADAARCMKRVVHDSIRRLREGAAA